MTAAAMVCVWPTQVYAATVAQAVVMIVVAMTAVVWLFYKALDTGRVRYWAAFGVIGCVGALTEPVLLPPMFFAGLLVLVWPSRLTVVRRFTFASVLLVCGLSILGPWTLRNYFVHDTAMPVKSTFWVNMWKGNNPNATGTDRLAMTPEQRTALEASGGLLGNQELARDPGFDQWRQYDLLSDAQRRELRGKPEVEREVIFGSYAKGWISANPGAYARLCMTRLAKTLWIDWDNPKARNPVYIVSRAVLLGLSAVGLVLVVRGRGGVTRWRLGWPAVIVGLALLTYTLTITAARFLLPIEPMLFVLSGVTLVAFADLVAGRVGLPHLGERSPA